MSYKNDLSFIQGFPHSVEYIPKELTNIQDFITKEEWTCDFSLKNNDLHLSPTGYDKFSDYLLKYITH